jgi:enamine deaminase RidA (YjgF/YER057c/UK114 family)
MQPIFIQHEPRRVYSKACVYGSFIFLAGEDCKDPKTQAIRGTTVSEQFDYTYQNMKATLESLGSSLENIVSLTTYVTDPRSRGAPTRSRQMAAARPAKHPHLRSSARRPRDAGRNSGHSPNTGEELAGVGAQHIRYRSTGGHA